MILRIPHIVLSAALVLVFVPLLHTFIDLNLASTASLFFKTTASISRQSEASSTLVPHHGSTEYMYDVGKTSYFSPLDMPIASLPIANRHSLPDESLRPVAVFRIPSNLESLESESLLSLIRDALDSDDVLTPAWLRTVLLVPEMPRDNFRKNLVLQADALSNLREEYGVEEVYLESSFTLPPWTSQTSRTSGLRITHFELPRATMVNGPFLASFQPGLGLSELVLFPVYRLYSDLYRTFVFGLYAPPFRHLEVEGKRDWTYKAFRKLDDHGYSLIPVPSRLYAVRSEDPVEGRRIAVKDLYDIKGVPTSAGCRAYGELYGPANSTAYSITVLEQLGGVIVGKTKTAAFAIGSKGHADTLDEQYPFSARGDLWQTCFGSSTGSGCAMGAYEWLDYAIGSDTSGSVRFPAAIVGLYGNRPSIGAIPLDGVVPAWEYSDTAGVLTRDPHDLREFLRAWYKDSPLGMRDDLSIPKTLKVSSRHWKQHTPELQAVVDGFVDRVSKTFDMKVEPVDVEGKIFEHIPQDDWEQKFYNVSSSLFWKEYHQVGKQFREDYAAVHGGRLPPVDPSIREEWNNGSRVVWDEQKYNDTMSDVALFKKWFENDILGPDAETCSDGILIYNLNFSGQPFYREEALNKHFIEREEVIQASMMCPLAGCVDIVVPIAQTPYESPVSGITEQTPVSVNLVAHQSCDLVLLDFIKDLADHGLIQKVKTGSTPF